MIFQKATLKRIAQCLTIAEEREDIEYLPFSLLPEMSHLELIQKEVQARLKVSFEEVEDAFPVTGLQQGFLSAMASNSSEYVLQSLYDIQNLDVQKLKESWNAVSDIHSICRTAFVSTKVGMYQVVLKKDYTIWNELKAMTKEEAEIILSQLLKEDRTLGFGFDNINFNRITLIPILEQGHQNDYILLITRQHAICDAKSIRIQMNALHDYYSGYKLESASTFREHVREVLKVDRSDCETFWKDAIGKIQLSSFPFLKAADTSKPLHLKASKVIQYNNNALLKLEKQLGVTRGIIIQSLWAIMIAKFKRTEDVVFGIVTSGREQDIAGVNRYIEFNLALLVQ
ncbi:hypothetical protein HDV01_004736 [Terramyces sp. JEL0728]|nr:hypothetical protein HDV01_004736 [Terramyces sp. JEL0728]